MNRTSTDDEIVFLSHHHPKKFICQMCDQDLTGFTVPQREFHYDEHLTDIPPASGSHTMSGGALHKSPVQSTSQPNSGSSSRPKPKPKSGFKPASTYFHKPNPNEQNVFWHASQTDEPPPNFSPGLITVLKKALSRMHEKGTTQRAWLAFEKVVHISSEHWDSTWGCGYRNYLMACAALMDQTCQPLYFPLLDAPVPPGVRNLQILLERAWRDNFDRDGAEDLDHKLVDTRQWIGTAELYVAFAYRGIPAQLVDFELHNGIEPLLQWVLEYFSGGDPKPKTTTVGEALLGARPVLVTDKLPIVLQHEGHSRTIVGCELVKGGAINLLTFDPGRKIPLAIRQAGLKYHNPSRPDESPSKSKRVLNQVIHPIQTIKSHKRKSPAADVGPSKRKRVNEDDVIVIDSDSDEDQPPRPVGNSLSGRADADVLDPGGVLKHFRLEPKVLRKHKKYQILWFPLEEPMSEAEKARRRVVTSVKIT